jgi:hypothetical protein
VLIRILPNQISTHWNIISYAIEKSLPTIIPVNENYMNNVLTALLSESLECWVSVNEAGEIEAVLTTQILTDFASQVKALLIYSLYGYFQISSKSWHEGFATLSEFARNSGCRKICCYSTNDSVISICKKFGGNVETFITFDM